MSNSEYIKTANKYKRLLLDSKINIDEYAENLITSCVLMPEIDRTTAHLIAASVPEIARESLGQKIARVLASNYRFPELQYGGSGPSQEVREEIRRLYQARIQACASALISALNAT